MISYSSTKTRELLSPSNHHLQSFFIGKADWLSMRHELSQYILSTTSVQEQWNDMENFLKSLMKKFIPTKVFQPQNHKPWITREIINDSSKHGKTPQNLKTYIIPKLFNGPFAHTQYLNSIFETDPPEDNKTMANKCFWSYVKTPQKDSCTVSPLRSEGVLMADAVEKANILKQYCSLFAKEENPVNTEGPSQVPTIPSIKVTAEGVQRLLKGHEPHKASGPDQKKNK